jgi:NAD+ synthase (glutamine-hydrolysing)
MSYLRIAMVQVSVIVGDLRGNLEKLSTWAGRARDAGADIITFPELAICGYPPEDLLLKPWFLEDNRAALIEMAGRTPGITAVVGFADHEGDNTYSAAALIHNAGIIDVYHKIELPNYGVFDEKRYFKPGDNCVVFQMSGSRFSIAVCEDIWIPDSKTEKCAIENGATAVLAISASPFHSQKLTLRREIISRFAGSTNTTVFFNNLVGGQDELVFDGGSMVVDSCGQVLSSARRFEEDLLLFDFPVTGSPIEVTGTRQSSTDSCVHALKAPASSKQKPADPRLAPDMGPIEEIYHALVLGTRDYVINNGFRKVLMGLSGGIDSAVTAAIATKALGSDNVMGVTMPSQFTSDATFGDSYKLAENLGIKIISIPIKGVFDSYMDVLRDALGSGGSGLEAENLQARIRGNILMAISNKLGWLVLTTGNKSETAVGYCTLYGDTAGGFAVIKDVPKTVVYELCEYINDREGREVIPRSIIERPPTAELRPDQKDEDFLPPYSILDPILEAYVELDMDPEEICRRGCDPRIVESVVGMVDRNEYKRRQAPPGVKITPKAFGKDRRLPITNAYSAASRAKST